MKQYLLTWMVFGVIIGVSAQDNVFLKRDYWKADPSIGAIEKAIEAGNDITELNNNMFDPVCYAILEETDNATVKHLIGKSGNAVDKITHDGRTYIFWAAYKGNLEMVQWLIEKGAKANIEDAHGNTVLNFAANAGQTDTELYDFLIANDADIKATTRRGANALLLVSASAKDENIINYFLEKGLAFESTDDDGNGIFQYTAKTGNINMLEILVEKGADAKLINKKGENALFMAAQGNRNHENGIAVFEFLENLGLSAELVTKEGKNLLHFLSSRNKDVHVFTYMLGKGLDVDLQDADGHTPLMLAARNNTLKVVKLLAEHTKAINAVDEKGRSALAVAVERNDIKTVSYLLNHGADVYVTDNKGNTLAYYLIQSYRAENPGLFETKWELLRSAGLSLKDKQHEGNTLVHLAAKENNLSLLQWLGQFDFDLNQKNNDGNTPLHLAAMSTSATDILEYLIDKGADVGLKTDFDETVFDLATENEFLQQQKIRLDFLKSK